MVAMKVGKCPTDQHSLTNRVVINPRDSGAVLGGGATRHICVATAPNAKFVFTVEEDAGISPGQLGFSMPQRKWAMLSINQDLEVSPYRFDDRKDFIGEIILTMYV